MLGTCPRYLDFAVVVSAPVATNAAGEVTIGPIPVSNSPSTIGQTAAAHVLVAGPSGVPPLSLAVTNAVFLTVGL